MTTRFGSTATLGQEATDQLDTSRIRISPASLRAFRLGGGAAVCPARRRAGLLRVVVGVIGEDLLPFVPVAEPQGSGDVLVDGKLGEPGGVVPVDVGG